MNIENNSVYCVSGIDTDIGKTIATGLLGRALLQNGTSVVTQKFVQTGCQGISEDILRHREIMGLKLLDVDRDYTTCPYVFPVPCSPHLAASIENKNIDPDVIQHKLDKLKSIYEIVLLEGAGGLLVPYRNNETFLDFVLEQRLPLILVTSSRLGSINHTLSALEVLAGRRGGLAGVVYNHDPFTDKRITEDTRNVIKIFLEKYSFHCPVVDLHPLERYEDGLSCGELLQLFK